MSKLTNKEKRKLYLIGYKSFNKNSQRGRENFRV